MVTPLHAVRAWYRITKGLDWNDSQTNYRSRIGSGRWSGNRWSNLKGKNKRTTSVSYSTVITYRGKQTQSRLFPAAKHASKSGFEYGSVIQGAA